MVVSSFLPSLYCSCNCLYSGDSTTIRAVRLPCLLWSSVASFFSVACCHCCWSSLGLWWNSVYYGRESGGFRIIGFFGSFSLCNLSVCPEICWRSSRVRGFFMGIFWLRHFHTYLRCVMSSFWTWCPQSHPMFSDTFAISIENCWDLCIFQVIRVWSSKLRQSTSGSHSSIVSQILLPHPPALLSDLPKT